MAAGTAVNSGRAVSIMRSIDSPRLMVYILCTYSTTGILPVPEIKSPKIHKRLDRCVRYSCQIFSRFNVPKVVKIGEFCRVIQKMTRWTFFGTRCIFRSKANHYCRVAEWLAYWTQAQKGPGSNLSRDAVRYRS